MKKKKRNRKRDALKKAALKTEHNHRILKFVYVAILLSIMLVPLAGTAYKKITGNPLLSKTALTGYVAVPDKPELTIANLASGKYQSALDAYFGYSLDGRPPLTRLYNQLLYSVFRANAWATSANGIVVGEDEWLFETSYIVDYLRRYSDAEISELKAKLNQVKELQVRLEELGKPFIVAITPSKASVYWDLLPEAYKSYAKIKRNGDYGINGYDVFLEAADETGLIYIDGHEICSEMRVTGTDSFPRGGTHWNGEATEKFIDHMIEGINNTGYLPQVRGVDIDTKSVINGNPFFTDGDLADLLNLLVPPFDFPSAHIQLKGNDTEYYPKAYIFGGSFSGGMIHAIYNWKNQSSYPIFSAIDFNSYNNTLMHYPENNDITEDINRFDLVLQNDVIVLEINEQYLKHYSPHFKFVSDFCEFLDQNNS
jgi:hypothetical protein